MSHPDPIPQLDAFVRLYEVAARSNIIEVEAELSRMPAHERVRAPGALALRGIRSILRGDPEGGCALLARAVDVERGEARGYLVDLLAPILMGRGQFAEVEQLLSEMVDAAEPIAPALLATRAATAARAGRDGESRALANAALADARRIDWPILMARVTQRISLAAFYREDFTEAQERGLEAARMFERLDAFRSAATAYSILYVVAYSHTGDVDMARFYAERVSLNAKRSGDESTQNYGLVSQLHIAAESGDHRRLGSIRARLLANPLHEQYQERFAFVISEALLAGWSGRFDSAAAMLRNLSDIGTLLRSERALCSGLLAVMAAGQGQIDEARRLARRAIGESAQLRGHEAKHERRSRLTGRFLASATCYLIGDSSRGARALSSAFDPSGVLRASLSASGVDITGLPPLIHGHALAVNAAFASARRLRPAHGLTPVEVEVLRLLSRGVTAGEVANERGRARKTIERQIESIYAKLGARNRTEAINRARDSGVLV